MAAGRIALQRFEEFVAERQSFAIETTLSGHSYARRFIELQHLGYQIHLFFLWIPSPTLAMGRIRHRVNLGGHDVPADVVLRRYSRTLRNFVDVYWPMADYGQIIDNSGPEPRPVAEKSADRIVVENVTLYNQIYGSNP
jgi:predicted ABC-type ATPase